ncbi:MAG: tRNA (cytidine(34)-2'-O)-methyltransferase [Phycisphaerales bacterium]
MSTPAPDPTTHEEPAHAAPATGTAAPARSGGAPPLLNLVMHEPEIPNNTGNIGRTCVATGCALHLIHPLAFDLSEKAVRRSGLDYWHRVQLREHADWGSYLRDTGIDRSRVWLTSTRGARPVWEAELRVGDHIVFGRETVGLPEAILRAHAEEHPGNLLLYPLLPEERSLNVASAASAFVYEGIRQFVRSGAISLDERGRIVRVPTEA